MSSFQIADAADDTVAQGIEVLAKGDRLTALGKFNESLELYDLAAKEFQCELPPEGDDGEPELFWPDQWAGRRCLLLVMMDALRVPREDAIPVIPAL